VLCGMMDDFFNFGTTLTNGFSCVSYCGLLVRT
jgi:hypothetical protein